MDLDELRELVDELRDEADDYEQVEAWVPAHLLLRDVADRVEERINAWWTELLTLQQAANETGYSYSALDKQVRAGRLEAKEDAGTRYVRRCDLPQHPSPPEDADLDPVVRERLGAGE